MRLIQVPSSIYGVLMSVVVLSVACAAQENSTVQTQMQRFTKDLPGCHAKPGPSQCASIHLVYPEVVSAPTPKAQSAIEGEIADLILSPLEKGKPQPLLMRSRRKSSPITRTGFVMEEIRKFRGRSAVLLMYFTTPRTFFASDIRKPLSWATVIPRRALCM